MGVDISQKMLEVARAENSDPNITYLNLPMENISEIGETFDVAVSSLALHYVEDFDGVVRDVYEMLNEDGVFVFSQENPLNTCFSGGDRWTRDEKGQKLYAHLSKSST